MSSVTASGFSLGSCWLRWDPHLHTPGTLRNDQYRDDWDGFFEKIEAERPPVAALGITDYFSLRSYKSFLDKRGGRIPGVGLVFPNVELRLAIETDRHQAINMHLLVCPDDEHHVPLMDEKLARLTFDYRGESYPCTDEGLKRLGRAYKGQSLTDVQATREGANQFKVEVSHVRELLTDDWFRKNVLVAMAAGNDGLGGIARDSAFGAQRDELGRLADIIFSGQPNDRLFWLGRHPDFAAAGHSPKPCLHGSDAHGLDAVLQPDLYRRCWIKGGPTFDSLRQALAEPERRVHIGEAPPPGPGAADTVRKLTVHNADWFGNTAVQLNPGLVTIIGARGSGKTALVDLLAFAAGANESEPGPASFIGKAGHMLDGTGVELMWGDGAVTSSRLPTDLSSLREARVQYLSQQFVERLCSPGVLGEPLVDEIERVVFNAIPAENRLECSTFGELRALLVESAMSDKAFASDVITTKSRAVAEEMARQASLPALREKAREAERFRGALEKELAAIPVRATQETVKAHQQANTRLQALKGAIGSEERRRQELRDVAAEVVRQVASAESAWEGLKSRHATLLDAATWELLKPRIQDAALPTLRQLEADVAARITLLRDKGLPQAPGTCGAQGPAGGLQALTADLDRLAKELGLDDENRRRKADLEKRLALAKADEEKAKKEVAYAAGATARIRQAQAERLEQYERVFRSLAAERETLELIYAPLRQRIAEEPRLSKLAFVVSRSVDVDGWAREGESLLDLRKPPFNGRGALADRTRIELLPVWSEGSPAEVGSAMRAFLEHYGADAVKSLAQDASPVDFGEWVFSTDHIAVRYSIEYEGMEIARLSPGSRGIVLLTLYLALDRWDLRPLVIDQPEENLDPSSVFSELVPFFRDAAARRQIVLVTHNANLVVNADSDQVIVASAERTSPASLPQIGYEAGGLEDPKVRSDVCRLLEGGEEAFRKRWQRYGMPPVPPSSAGPRSGPT
jgi:hypothetical protein